MSSKDLTQLAEAAKIKAAEAATVIPGQIEEEDGDHAFWNGDRPASRHKLDLASLEVVVPVAESAQQTPTTPTPTSTSRRRRTLFKPLPLEDGETMQADMDFSDALVSTENVEEVPMSRITVVSPNAGRTSAGCLQTVHKTEAFVVQAERSGTGSSRGDTST